MFDITKTLIPYPRYVKDYSKEILIGKISKPAFHFVADGTGVVFDEAVNLFKEKSAESFAFLNFDGDFGYEIRLITDAYNEKICGKSEAYTICIDEGAAVVTASDEAGAYYGIVTLTALMHCVGECVYLPKVDITDYPEFKYRGQFLECRYGSDFMTLEQWKDAVDYFASLKQNELTIGLYGCWGVQYDNMRSEYLYIPFKKYPQLKTPRHIKYFSVKQRKWIIEENVLPQMFKDDFFGDLVEYGKRKNVNIKPLFNSLGHNSLIPRVFPEISAKNADGTDKKYGFCTKSQKTLDFMFSLYDEIIEKYIAPFGCDSIHIGLDEVMDSIGVYEDDIYKKVSPFCECELCRGKEKMDLVIDYTVELCKYLKSKGIKNIHIYQDMFFVKENVINEQLKKRFVDEGIYDNVIIHWWSYKADGDIFWGKPGEVNNIFRSIMKPMTGYYHWSIPPETNLNIQILAKMAKELGYEGIEAYTGYDECFDKGFKYSAEVSWNMDNIDDFDEFNRRYAAATFGDASDDAVKSLENMREIMANDLKYGDYRNNIDYYYHSYLKEGKPYPRNYPEDAFRFISEDDGFLKYLRNAFEKSSSALKYFESCRPSHITDVWALIARQYAAFSDFFITLTKLDKSSDKAVLKKEIGRLLNEWEELMNIAENVRIKENSYMYFRNLSIMHRFLSDLYDHVCEKLNKGEDFTLDVTDFSCVKSEMYNYIR